MVQIYKQKLPWITKRGLPKRLFHDAVNRKQCKMRHRTALKNVLNYTELAQKFTIYVL